MDSESRAAGSLLTAMSRAVERFDELRHPFVRREPFSYLVPGGATAGVHLVLPDGRMVRFAVSVAFAGNAFEVAGEVLAEERSLVELRTENVTDVREALDLLDGYVHEVVSPGRRILESLLEEVAES